MPGLSLPWLYIFLYFSSLQYHFSYLDNPSRPATWNFPPGTPRLIAACSGILSCFSFALFCHFHLPPEHCSLSGLFAFPFAACFPSPPSCSFSSNYGALPPKTLPYPSLAGRRITSTVLIPNTCKFSFSLPRPPSRLLPSLLLSILASSLTHCGESNHPAKVLASKSGNTGPV